MSQYILINHIRVQNANAIAGFTWGFPAITHFLGFSHNLARKLAQSDQFSDLDLRGCAVISHKHHIHTYRTSYDVEFTQSRNPPYLPSHNKTATPPIIEEGKMNMTVSLLIECEGNIGDAERLCQWFTKTCLMQRLAGGTILDIRAVSVENDEANNIACLKHKVLPGFVLMDRSNYLKEHHEELQKEKDEAELFDAWLDFSALKQKARPQSNDITKHLIKIHKRDQEDEAAQQRLEVWQTHKGEPYQKGNIPKEIKDYFANFTDEKKHKKLLGEWESYCHPTEKTKAVWEYLKKPKPGYLVPIMTGYKAISKVYKNHEVEHTRDHETDVCFVESVHSVGEWLSVHRLGRQTAFQDTLWHYYHEENWYLCQQNQEQDVEDDTITIEPADDF